MQATLTCWAFFRRKGLTLELRGYLHSRKEQQREKEIRANGQLQRRKVMCARANDMMIIAQDWLWLAQAYKILQVGEVCKSRQVQMMKRGSTVSCNFNFLIWKIWSNPCLLSKIHELLCFNFARPSVVTVLTMTEIPVFPLFAQAKNQPRLTGSWCEGGSRRGGPKIWGRSWTRRCRKYFLDKSNLDQSIWGWGSAWTSTFCPTAPFWLKCFWPLF